MMSIHVINNNTSNNTGDTTNDIINVDKQAPMTTIDTISSLANTKFKITFKATDNTKVKRTYYRVGYLPWKI